MRSQLIYVAGRFVGVLSRPAGLFLANNLLDQEGAHGLALAFLVSSLGLAAVAADPHRRFYAREFSAEGGRAHPLVREVYVASVALLMVLGALLGFCVAWHFGHSVWLAVAAAIYFVSEKLVDEALRYRLFDKAFTNWGALNVARGASQMLLFLLLLAMQGPQLSAPLAVSAFAAGNLLVFGAPVVRALTRAVARPRPAIYPRLALRAARSLFSNRRLWFIALATAGIGYLDRLVALVIDPGMLPVFMLVIMCFSVVQMAVDFFYISRHRREFLERRITLRDLLGRNGVLPSLFGGLAVAVVACVAVLFTARNASEFPLAYVIAIAIVQVTVALALALREIIYWTRELNRILQIEVLFWACFATIVFSVWLFQLPIATTLIMVLGVAVLRLALFGVSAGRVAR